MKKNLLLFSLLLTVVCANAQLSGYVKEGFEDNRFPPKGWEVVGLKGSSAWTRTTVGAHSGNASAFNSYNVPEGINYLISPQFTAATGDSLSFWFTPRFSGFTDSLFIQISTTNKNKNSFTTVASFADGDSYPAAGTWQKVSLSLAAYAGQNIYVAFLHVDENGDGVLIDDVEIGAPPPDVASFSIDLNKLVTAGQSISPQATYQNLGLVPATFDVTFTVDSYTSTKTITNLSPGETQQVTFDPWNVPSAAASYKAVTYTNYTLDADHSNDTLKKDLTSILADVAAIEINLSNAQAGSVVTPQATFENISSLQPATFDVTLNIGSYTSTKTVSNLPYKSTQTVTFDSWTTPSTPSTLTATAYTSLPGDGNTANDTITKLIALYGTFTADWIKAKHTPAPGFDMGTTSYSTGTAPNDTTYLVQIGGVNDLSAAQATKSGRKFNTKTNDWSAIAPVPQPRFTTHAFYYNGKIFYIGGYHASFFTFYNAKETVSIYDIASDTWSEGAPMLFKVGGYASCQQDSLIYIIGGFNGNVFENKVQVYNINTNTWLKGTNIPSGREGFAAGVAGNKIVYTGGQDETGKLNATAFVGTINSSDPAKIKWTQIADYPGGNAYRLAGTGIKNASSPMVYFTGGSSNGSADASKAKTWAYNTNTNEWLKGPNKPTQVSNVTDFAPFVYNDTVYLAVIGGIDQNGSITNANEWLVLGPTSQVLPIHLLAFTATLQNNKTLLNWNVAEDGTGGYYIIQRSSDAVHFADMSEKLNAGRTATTKAYSSYDLLPMKGYNYYRIKIVNADGSIAYSAIKAVNNNAVSASVYACSVYPNPTRGLLNVLLQNNSGTETTIGVAISDVAGRKMINENKTVGASLNLSYNLKPGTYIVNMFSQDGTWKQSVKVVVE